MRQTNVLVVEADADERERFATWLEEAGFEVATCPGPSAPDYTCVGGREGSCPLLEGAEVVVMDLSLDSELVMAGTFAEELVALYRGMDKPIVALSRGGAAREEPGGRTVRLARHPAHDDLLRAVRRLAVRGGAATIEAEAL